MLRNACAVFRLPLLTRQYYDNNTEGDRLAGTVACVEEIKKAGNVQGVTEETPLFGKLINSKPNNIRQMLFLFLESRQNAVLHERVLNKTSLKWRP